MVVEPVGITLAAVGLLQPLFVTCRALYKTYQHTQSFGDDFGVAQLHLYIQYARLEGISQRKLRFLKHSFAPWDEEHYITKAIICELIIIKKAFQACNVVLKKYHDIEQEETEASDDDTTAGAEETGPEAGPSNPRAQIVLPPSETKLKPATVSRSLLSFKPSRSKSSLHLDWKSAFSRRKKEKGAAKSPSIANDPSSGATTPNTGDESSVTQQQGSTPATTNTPSLLESQSAQEAARKQGSHAKDLKSSNQILRRLGWAVDDKKIIYDRIRELRDSNDELESLLEYRSPGNVLDIAGSSVAEAPVQGLPEIQASVKRLHDVLTALDGSNGAKQMSISVQLRADCKGLYDELPDDNDLALRKDSCLFLIHVHGLDNVQDEHQAVELLVETTFDTYQENQIIPLKPLSSFVDLKEAIDSETNKLGFKQLGTLARKAPPSDVHQIFCTNQRTWYKVDDLDQVLGTEEFRDKFNPIQRIQLASLVTITHLYFAKIRVACTDVSPANFTYYNTNSNAITWDEYEPFVLNPYISIGFGARKPPRTLGASSGRPQQKNNTVAELGLLLHQIGSSLRIEYGQGPEGFRRAKEKALHTIHAIENGAGVRYAEVAQMCLEWKPSNSYSGPGDEDWRLIQLVVAWLRDFEDKLESS